MLPVPPVPKVLRERMDWTVPSPEWEAWAKATFVDPRSALFDPGLAHLASARIGFLLTNAVKEKGGVRWAGSGGAFKPGGDGWAKAQSSQRMEEWFGHLPDFLITLDVTSEPFRTVRGTCFVVNHELRHCGQAADEHGAPAYGRDGRPIWETVPHFAELNEDDLRRWGAATVRGGERIARELAGPPEITDAMLENDA